MRHVYKEIYSFPVIVGAQQVVNLSTPVYFTGFPPLLSRQVNAIAVSSTNNALDSYLLTLVDDFGSQLWFQYPLYDLQLAPEDAGNIPVRNSILRQTCLKNIDLSKSFFTSSLSVGYASESTIFTLHFYS